LTFLDGLKADLISDIGRREEAKLARAREQEQALAYQQQHIAFDQQQLALENQARQQAWEASQREALEVLIKFYKLIQESKPDLDAKVFEFFEDRFFELLDRYDEGYGSEIVAKGRIRIKLLREEISKAKKVKAEQHQCQLLEERGSKFKAAFYSYNVQVQVETLKVDSYLSFAFSERPDIVEQLFSSARQYDPGITTREELRQYLLNRALGPLHEKFKKFVQENFPK
jgi:hypothetical protein